MAKFTRFDPRNKKKNRHKNHYLDRSRGDNSRRKDLEDYNDNMYEKYALTKVVDYYNYSDAEN